MQSIGELGNPALADVLNPARYTEVPVEQLVLDRYYIFRRTLNINNLDIFKVKYVGPDDTDLFLGRLYKFKVLDAIRDGIMDWHGNGVDDQDAIERKVPVQIVHFFIPVQNGGKRRGRKARKSRKARKTRSSRK